MKKTLISLIITIAFIVSVNSGNSLFAGDLKDQLVYHLDQTVQAGEILSIIEELASPEYGGRLTGSAGYDKAADFAAAFFKKHGIKPMFEDYFQSFPVSYTRVYESTLEIFTKDEEAGAESIKCSFFDDFYPLNFSGSGDVTADVVFVGHGITAPEYGYDDFKGIDLKGKIALIYKGFPRGKEGENWVQYDKHRVRIANAVKNGAKGVLYIYNARCNPNGDYRKSLPGITITPELADKILAKQGKKLADLKKGLDARENQSFNTGVKVHMMVRSENFQSEAKNVVGYIPGISPQLKDEFIIIGAHLDHCGQWPRLTPGAEDNASGSAAVLAAAKALGTFKHKPQRSVMFILFAGEEMGLLGSRYAADHLPPQVKKARFMINMDMVGAGPDMWIMRLKNHQPFEDTVREAHKTFKMVCKVNGNRVTKARRANTDHYAFSDKGIPAVSIFSAGGEHHGYHSDEDTIYWITPRITEDIVKIISFTAFFLQ